MYILDIESEQKKRKGFNFKGKHNFKKRYTDKNRLARRRRAALTTTIKQRDQQQHHDEIDNKNSDIKNTQNRKNKW